MSKVVGYSRTVPVRAVEGPSSPSSPGMTNLAWKTMIKGICQSLSCVVCVTRARFADTGASPPHGATAARCLPLEWPLVRTAGALRATSAGRARGGGADHSCAMLSSRSSTDCGSLALVRSFAPFPFSDHGQFYILGAYLQKPATKLLSAVRCPVPQSPVRRPPTRLSRLARGLRVTPKPESRKPQTCSHGA